MVDGGHGPDCHAPAFARNDAELLDNIWQIWNKQQRLSRAGLEKELQRLLRDFRLKEGAGQQPSGT